MNHKGTVTLETERLILRRFEMSDADALFHSLHSRIGDSPAALGEFFRVNWLASYNSPENYQWLIVLKSTGEPIGTIRADGWDIKQASLELGYEVGDRWWHQGIASEAANRVAKFFFEEVGVRRIAARHSADNPRSGGVALNCGMKLEEAGEDVLQYAMLAEDYFNMESENNKPDSGFWSAIDKLISESKIIIDRPKNTKHPRFDFTYPLDYGYLENTSSMDGGGIDVWRGNAGTDMCDAIICTVDLLKKDSEIKLLLSCTEDEKDIVMRCHNDSEHMKGVMIRRSDLC